MKFLTTCLALAALPAWAGGALPTGGVVVHGAGVVQTNGVANNQVHTQTSNLTLDWSNYRISAGNSAQFLQPATSTIALNPAPYSPPHIYGVLSPARASLPTGGVVARGEAAIQSSGNAMTITQGTDRAVINWGDFSVGAGNSVQFIQPSASSAVLNRVITSNPSQIDGLVSANGQVFILNPNGINVGVSGRIEAAGINLSTAPISDEDFMAATLVYEAPVAGTAIIMDGELVATESIELRAETISVSGLLDAPWVSFEGLPATEVEPDPESPGATEGEAGYPISLGRDELLNYTTVTTTVTKPATPPPVVMLYSIMPGGHGVIQPNFRNMTVVHIPDAPQPVMRTRQGEWAMGPASVPGHVPAVQRLGDASLAEGAVTVRLGLTDLTALSF